MVLGYLKLTFASTSVNFWQITSEIARNLLISIMGKVLDFVCTLDREHNQLTAVILEVQLSKTLNAVPNQC